MKRRSFISLAIPAALTLGGVNAIGQTAPADASPNLAQRAASTMPLPTETARSFNTIREADIQNRPVSFTNMGRKVRRLTIQSRIRGESSTVQNRDSYGFRATWKVMDDIEFFVVAEVGTFATAKAVAQRHLDALSRIPYCFRKEIQRVTIVDGKGTFRGGGGNIYTFADQAPSHNEFQGVIFHEVLHSVDHAMSASQRAAWKAAQTADRKAAPRFDGFVSSYARQHPDREDFPSAAVPWFSLRKHPERLTSEQRAFIREQIPNRIKFLNAHYPV